jgi:hypothetical protein
MKQQLPTILALFATPLLLATACLSEDIPNTANAVAPRRDPRASIEAIKRKESEAKRKSLEDLSKSETKMRTNMLLERDSNLTNLDCMSGLFDVVTDVISGGVRHISKYTLLENTENSKDFLRLSIMVKSPEEYYITFHAPRIPCYDTQDTIDIKFTDGSTYVHSFAHPSNCDTGIFEWFSPQSKFHKTLSSNKIELIRLNTSKGSSLYRLPVEDDLKKILGTNLTPLTPDTSLLETKIPLYHAILENHTLLAKKQITQETLLQTFQCIK